MSYTQEQAQKAVKWIEETSTQLAVAEFNDQPTVGEILVQMVRDLREAALAFQELATCYRVGKRPSENLFTKLVTKLDKAREALRKTGGDHV